MSVLIYGITNSITLALIALGFSLTFGISGIANFAYGAFYIIGGLLTFELFIDLGLPYFLSAIIAIGIVGLLGFAFYWGVLLRLRGMLLNEVIATFAVGIAILQLLRWKGFYGYRYALPVFVKGSVEIGGVAVDYQRLFIIGVGVILVLFIYLFTHHTRVGLSFRGIAQNERTAISLGIESDWTGALSLAFGSALAAVAAIMILPLGIIDVNQGYDVLIYALAVGILGGLESIPGIIMAAFVLGFSQILMATFFKAEWMIVIILLAIILVLALRPSGILGKSKELEERV